MLNLRGTTGDDRLSGDVQNETLAGLDGNDQLYGNGGSDTLGGGKGDDSLSGGTGTDMYLFALGDGADVISGDNQDTLRFGSDISSADIVVERAGAGLVLQHQNGSDSVKIINWYGSTYAQLQRVVFDSDGTVWSAYTLNNMGVNHDSQYEFNLGEGAKTILDWGGLDSLPFGAGILDTDMAIARVGQDLRFTHENGTDSVTIKDWFNSLENQLETIRFSATGTVLTRDQHTTPFLTLSGTAGNDTIQGGNA